MDARSVAIHWFRKGLRLHDNPALLEACARASTVLPVFIIDPNFAKPNVIGINRYSFLLESLRDLDSNLRRLGSRLYVLRGAPEDRLSELFLKLNVNLLTYEVDTEPYSITRDRRINELAKAHNVCVASKVSHTLHDMQRYLGRSQGTPPTTYGSFTKLFDSLGPPEAAAPSPEEIPSAAIELCQHALKTYDTTIPELEEMGYLGSPTTIFHGGESEALRRLSSHVLSRAAWVGSFSKPDTAPNALEPSTTVLSPYLKFGCLSARRMYFALVDILTELRRKGKTTTLPPVSLVGQLMWREFFYLSSVTSKNFDKMMGNPSCKQIPWQRDSSMIEAWKSGCTGYPFIDAIMTQLRVDGWIHHLARHAVACFLTRGDLWQHWEEGARVFDLYLLDSDWALNNANWQWLSCSNFFYQYFRCYSPVAFGKKTDKNGDYIRKWIPKLSKYPSKYIYEPWTAPLGVQRECGCVVGVDYPSRLVDHDIASKANMEKMKLAYANQHTTHTAAKKETGDADEDGEQASSAHPPLSRKRKRDL